MLDGHQRVARQRNVVTDRLQEILVTAVVVRRIRIDKAENRGLKTLHSGEDIGGDGANGRAPLGRQTVDLVGRFLPLLNGYGTRDATRRSLEREDATAGEEIEEMGARQAGADDVEVGLARTLRRGTQIMRRQRNLPASQLASRDT